LSTFWLVFKREVSLTNEIQKFIFRKQCWDVQIFWEVSNLCYGWKIILEDALFFLQNCFPWNLVDLAISSGFGIRCLWMNGHWRSFYCWPLWILRFQNWGTACSICNDYINFHLECSIINKLKNGEESSVHYHWMTSFFLPS